MAISELLQREDLLPLSFSTPAVCRSIDPDWHFVKLTTAVQWSFVTSMHFAQLASINCCLMSSIYRAGVGRSDRERRYFFFFF